MEDYDYLPKYGTLPIIKCKGEEYYEVNIFDDGFRWGVKVKDKNPYRVYLIKPEEGD